MKNFIACQSEEYKNAEYLTFVPERKSVYGFVCVFDAWEVVSLVAFDSATEYAEMTGEDFDYSDLENLNVGESMTFDGNYVWTRIW